MSTPRVVRIQLEIPPEIASHLGEDEHFDRDLERMCQDRLLPAVLSWARARVLQRATPSSDGRVQRLDRRKPP